MPVRHGPSRWKRLLYSVVSVLLAVLLLSLLDSITIALWDLPHFAAASSFLDAALFLAMVTLPLGLIGWLLALPIVLSVTNFFHWRFLGFWAIGTALGPLTMFGIFLVGLFRDPQPLTSFSLPSGMMWFSTAVACLVTLFYLLLVRLDQRRARVDPAQNTQPLEPTPQAP